MDGWEEEAKCVEECCRPPLAGESATGCAPGLTRGRPPPLAHAWASFGPDRTRGRAPPPAMGSASTRRAYHAVGLRGSDAAARSASGRAAESTKLRRGVRAQVLHRPHAGVRASPPQPSAPPPRGRGTSSDVGCGSWISAAECRAAVGERWERIEVHRCCR